MSRPRVSRGRLGEIWSGLSERDVSVLESVAANRYLTSRQIRRMHFSDHATEAALIRASNRALARLAELGLMEHLRRCIGGVRAGSGSHVWSLTEAGARLLTTFDGFGTLPARLRSHEPTITFLEHTLAVAEACLTLSEAAQHGRFDILDLQREPDCWRAYSAPHGGVAQLKPDLALVTASGEYEDHWFLEIDRDTEPPARVVRACLRYEEYRRSGAEQRAIEVFPAVVWVVPDPKRAATLKRHMNSEPRLSRTVFTVVTIEELQSVIATGIGAQERGDES